MIKTLISPVCAFLTLFLFVLLATAEPPAANAKPPTANAEPPTATTKPPTATTKPPTATTKPPTATTKPPTATAKPSTATAKPSTATAEPPTATVGPPTSDDLVEVVTLEGAESIVIDLPYASTKNFTKKKLYPVERCYLRREVALKLVEVQRALSKHGVGLKIWDGYRPHPVQYIMWDNSPLPGFVGNPDRGSKHNRGAAVDVTLVDLKTRKERSMPTPYDEFSLRAHKDFADPNPENVRNRQLLQDTMTAHGFTMIRKEWWHFDYHEWRKFPLEKIGLDELAKRDSEAKKKKKKKPFGKIFKAKEEPSG